MQLVSELVRPGYLPPAGPGSIAPYFPAMNLAVRRTLLLEAGGFDPRLRTGEDIDVCLRALQNGTRLWFEPTARVAHHNRRTMGALWRQWFDYGRWHARLYDKHVEGRIEVLWLDRSRRDGRYRALWYRQRAPVRAIVFLNPFFLAILATLLAPWLPWLPALAWAAYFVDDLRQRLPWTQRLAFAGVRLWINLALLLGGLRGGLGERYLFVYGTVWCRSR